MKLLVGFLFTLLLAPFLVAGMMFGFGVVGLVLGYQLAEKFILWLRALPADAPGDEPPKPPAPLGNF